MADGNRLHSINTSRILRTIRQNPGISRIKVAELLDLDRSTVTKIMQVILENGLVETAGKNTEQSGVGRRQINLRINEDIGVVLGIEIQDTRYSAVIIRLSGTILHSFDGSVTVSMTNLTDRILSVIATAKEYVVRERLFLLGIGIGLPGILDPYTGKIIRCNSLHIGEPRDIRPALEAGCPEPVFLENDANCCCWGELAFHPENRDRNFLAVLGEFRDAVPGTSDFHGFAIGLGLVIRERVLHGDHFTAGEYRSEAASSATGQFSIPYGDFHTLPGNTALLREVYRELAGNLAFLVNCVDLTKIVFTGDIPAHRENLEEIMEEAIARNWIYSLERNIAIEFSENGNQSVCLGAAGLFVEKLFSVPDIAGRIEEAVGYDLYENILKRKGQPPWNT